MENLSDKIFIEINQRLTEAGVPALWLPGKLTSNTAHAVNLVLLSSIDDDQADFLQLPLYSRVETYRATKSKVTCVHIFRQSLFFFEEFGNKPPNIFQGVSPHSLLDGDRNMVGKPYFQDSDQNILPYSIIPDQSVYSDQEGLINKSNKLYIPDDALTHRLVHAAGEKDTHKNLLINRQGMIVQSNIPPHTRGIINKVLKKIFTPEANQTDIFSQWIVMPFYDFEKKQAVRHEKMRLNLREILGNPFV